MTGTHYILDRDRPENQNPMDLIKEKACRTCGTVKPNDFKNFGKKLWKTRHDLTTNEVCNACQKAKVSASMKEKWKGRKVAGHDYEVESLRMARSIHEAMECRLKAQAAVDVDLDDTPGIKRIDPV